MAYAVFAEGLDNLANLDEVKDDILKSAVQAINKTADRARTRAAEAIRQQVAFPAQYLAPSSKRLIVTERATMSGLEAKIRARHRPTSLARFVSGTPRRGQGVSVEVQPGRRKNMPRAFLMKLRSGSADIDTRHNMGLAVRLRPGETLANKRNVIAMKNGLYLLYGPSVNQVFWQVSQDIQGETVDYLEAEFSRLLEI
jgi:hypothetical protein